MEVWILEKYYIEDGMLYVLGVFENADVAMNTVNDHEDIMWTQTGYTNSGPISWMTNQINEIIYYLNKWEVVLDEMPNK